MFVDASAVVAILIGEADADELSDKIDDAGSVIVSPMVRYETVLAIARDKRLNFGSGNNLVVPSYLKEAEVRLGEFLDETEALEMPITSEIGTAAIRALARYGRGTGHPAKLNFGDCFSYACAKSAAVPLLFKGDDFIHTDVDIA